MSAALLLPITTVAVVRMAVAVDSAMHTQYHMLANHLLDRDTTGSPHWVCIAGGPGSGKSTMAAAICELVNEAAGRERAVVLPMDGFHYSRQELRKLDPPDAAQFLPRRGAPWTFDAEACVSCLTAAKRDGEATLPNYSRELSDPVPGGVRLKRSHDIVLVEGNCTVPSFRTEHCVLFCSQLSLGYVLFMRRLADLLMKHDPRWAPLDDLWDERWFLRCRDPAAQRRRLIMRHLETWNEEKTKRWGPGEQGAAARADANDVLNMELIALSEVYAEQVIESI